MGHGGSCVNTCAVAAHRGTVVCVGRQQWDCQVCVCVCVCAVCVSGTNSRLVKYVRMFCVLCVCAVCVRRQ